MKKSYKHSKYISFLFITLILFVSAVLAVQLNWFNFGHITGTINPSANVLQEANLDLGNLNGGSNFQVSNTTTLTVPSTDNGGVKVSNLLLSIPSAKANAEAVDYLIGRFNSLYVNFTLNSINYSIPIIKAGDSSPFLSSWSVKYDDYWFYYSPWINNNVFLPTGSYSIPITVYGQTTIVYAPLTIDMHLAFELS